MKFFISKSKKLPREAQKQLLPRKEFMAQGRERFLAAFDASALARNARPVRARADGRGRPAYVTTLFKIGVGALAVLAVGVGLSAYADTANVSATNPLYPLKRLSENVQLALAPAAEKPQLQATFAVRRANEIASLQASAPSSTLIPQLTTDLDQDISSSLNAAAAVGSGNDGGRGGRGGSEYGNDNGRETTATSSSTISTTTSTAPSPANVGSINIYCAAFNVSTSGVLVGHLESDLALHPGAMEQFNRQCGDQSRGNSPAGRGQQDISNASTTVATTTRTTTATGTNKFGGHRRDGL